MALFTDQAARARGALSAAFIVFQYFTPAPEKSLPTPEIFYLPVKTRASPKSV